VVAGQEDVRLGIVQAEMIGRVPGRVHHEPLPARELEHVAVLDGVRDGGNDRRRAQQPHGGPAHANAERRSRALPAPGRESFAPRLARLLGGRIRLLVVGRLVGFLLGGQIVHRDLGRLALRRRGPEAKGVMGDDPGAGLLGEARCAPEVVGMGVRDDHGVDVARGEPRLLEPVLEGAPGAGARHPGVHHRRPLAVDDGVAVDVAEPGHADRQLHPQHVGGDFGDVGARRLLLLSSGHPAP
jgi:hypothetical protein